MSSSHTSSITAIPLLGILMYGLSVFSPAHAETLRCRATTALPAVITVPGVYCLKGNLFTNMISGNAIEIQANNVTIDLNGFILSGLAAGDSTDTNGVYADQRKNITIKNGIVSGFGRGIWLRDDPPRTSSSGHVVTDILADQNTFESIRVEGFGNTVSHNKVVDAGGSTLTNDAYGILVLGPGAKVVNNTVSTTTATGPGVAYGILLGESNYSLAQDNTVTDTLKGTGTSYAILIDISTGVFVRDNNLANADSGVAFGSSTGIYRDNLTFDVITPFIGGTDGGGNVSAP